MKYKEISGLRFGRLVVLERIISDKIKLSRRKAFFKCRCDCGNIKIVSAELLRNGKTKSCGCLRKEVISKLMTGKGRIMLQQTKDKISKANKGKTGFHWKGKNLPEYIKEKLSKSMQGRRVSKKSEFKKGHIWDKEIEERRLKNTLKSLFKRPTTLEREFKKLIDKNKLDYKYTGNGEILIGYKNPDFINTNGLKICIEVRAGDAFFHNESYIIERKEHFKKYGWECIVFVVNRLSNRRYDLDEKFILTKIKQKEEELTI